MWALSRRYNVEPKGDIIWLKSVGKAGDTAWGSWRNPSDMHLFDNHEYISVFRKNGKRESLTSKPVIDEESFLMWRHSDWSIKPESAKSIGHIAPFPIEIPKRLITLYTFEGETVLDPFVGSGTTGVACAQLNRDFIGIDHSSEYIELARQRIGTARANLGQADRPLKNNLVQLNAFI